MDQRGTSVFLDNFRIFTNTWLGPMDNESPYDGTIDGAGAWGRDGGVTVVEMAHPLNSTDNDHDFSLAEGDAVGFYGFFGLWDPDDDSSSGWTDFPVPYWNIPEWGDIIVAAPDPQTKEDCLDDHWRLLGFDNVGMCMRYFRTGVDTRN